MVGEWSTKNAEHVVNIRPNTDVVVKATVSVVEAYPTHGAPAPQPKEK